jgi:hypothetical protein
VRDLLEQAGLDAAVFNENAQSRRGNGWNHERRDGSHRAFRLTVADRPIPVIRESKFLST